MSNKKLIVGITIPGSVGLLKGQLKYFKEQGYDTYLLTQHDERSLNYCRREECKCLNVSIMRNISLKDDIKTLLALIKIFKKEKPDIVNVGTPKMGMLGMMAAWWCRVPNRIYTCRGFRYEHERGSLKYILKFCEWLAGFCAQKIICISPSVKTLGVKDGVFKEKKCVVIHKGSSNGIDPNYFNRKNVESRDTEILRKKLGLEGRFVYGFLGRIVDRKGIRELYEAFGKVYEQDKNCRLLIVGPWEFSQITDKTLYDKMLAHEGIIIPGRTDDVPLHLTAMDVFVLPAWWEGFGNVVVQAADMGLPVIGSKGTGVCDAVCDGFNGVNVEPKNSLALYDAMIKMKDDRELRERFAANGPIWGQNFKSEIIWAGMNELYKT
ncbi:MULTISPECIES: glycosyltransferase family 4 protein [unclassified Butyricimonas]|uniref:glycosyltransferase family 4 protein n=1 Tax=unclassified Butyricimonas TaxID=2637652 RepID=UPI000C0872C7|nr:MULTISPECIES: glycosyltransferase family 4 protein [unclassified Butyricimonas]